MNSQALGRSKAVIALAALGALVVAVLVVGSPGTAAGAVDPADLALTKSDSPDPVFKGKVLTYTITVRNNGPDPATDTVVEDKLPGGLNFISASTTAGNCTEQGKTVTCNLGTLALAAQVTITIRARVTKEKGTIDNTATVESPVADLVATNNSDTERTTVRVPPSGPPSGPTCQGRAATIIGTGGDNVLVGTPRRDVILAGGGNDRVFSGGGSDVVCAGAGFDLVRSGAKGDSVSGGVNPDRLRGGGGADALRGNGGPDQLRGGPGPDLLSGGLGRDRCRGGAGADTLRSCEL